MTDPHAAGHPQEEIAHLKAELREADAEADRLTRDCLVAEVDRDHAREERDTLHALYDDMWAQFLASQADLQSAREELQICRGINPLSGNPSDWGHAVVIEGLIEQRDAADAELTAAREERDKLREAHDEVLLQWETDMADLKLAREELATLKAERP